MYLVSLALLLVVLPAASIAADVISHPGVPVWIFAGKWFTFWAVGARLFIAGLRQTAAPRITAAFFNLKSPVIFPMVRQIGAANLAIGALGLASIIHFEWILPAALAGGLYCGFSAAVHITGSRRTRPQQIAFVADLIVFLALAAFVAADLQ